MHSPPSPLSFSPAVPLSLHHPPPAGYPLSPPPFSPPSPPAPYFLYSIPPNRPSPPPPVYYTSHSAFPPPTSCTRCTPSSLLFALLSPSSFFVSFFKCIFFYFFGKLFQFYFMGVSPPHPLFISGGETHPTHWRLHPHTHLLSLAVKPTLHPFFIYF